MGSFTMQHGHGYVKVNVVTTALTRCGSNWLLLYRSMLASNNMFFLPLSMGVTGAIKAAAILLQGPRARTYQSSSRVALWKHSTVHTRMKKDVNSMNMAPVSIRPACRRMAGIARLPMADAPVRNFAALIHLTKG
jgi:hypothetical protein